MHGKDQVTLIPIRFPTVEVGQRLAPLLIDALRGVGISPMRGDVIAIASKVVSTCEGRIVRLQDVKVTFPARRLARRYEIDERLTTVVVSESDRIFGGVKGFLLTLKRGILTANAGVDTKNAPLDTAILWPKNSDISAKRLRHCLDRQYHTSICVEVVDSRVTPLRLGTTGLAIGLSGFSPVRDERRTPDIYGRTIRVTQTNVADDLAASAHLLMGEAASKIAAVIIRNADLKTTKGDSHAAIIEMKRCLVSSSLKKGI